MTHRTSNLGMLTNQVSHSNIQPAIRRGSSEAEQAAHNRSVEGPIPSLGTIGRNRLDLRDGFYIF